MKQDEELESSKLNLWKNIKKNIFFNIHFWLKFISVLIGATLGFLVTNNIGYTILVTIPIVITHISNWLINHKQRKEQKEIKQKQKEIETKDYSIKLSQFLTNLWNNNKIFNLQNSFANVNMKVKDFICIKNNELKKHLMNYLNEININVPIYLSIYNFKQEYICSQCKKINNIESWEKFFNENWKILEEQEIKWDHSFRVFLFKDSEYYLKSSTCPSCLLKQLVQERINLFYVKNNQNQLIKLI